MMSIVGLILVAQAAAVPAAASAAPPPDIEITARIEVGKLDIRSAGDASLVLHAEPGDAPPVAVERSLPTGRRSYRNLRIDIHGVARLTAPAPIAAITTTTGDPR